jgi:exonuclease SbcC
MRILAIRGKNLASLADPFEVDLEAEPIRSSGIFAITGPTGAGKTTLLDAICLALFDSLPRMDTAEKGASVGRIDGDSAQQIKYDDVRGILRHGCGAGYSEVDFVGQDGRRYRSRWEVNRARGKAEGKLQFQKITLTDIGTGQIIGDKKTDTLQQIEKRIGLNFDQFRRSVLLAQGDFDTFIKASSKDRAELLERITGTEIYSRISQAAFARAKQEREALHDLETQLGEYRPLSYEERAAAEDRVKEAKNEADCIEAEKAVIAKAKEWYETKTRLDERVAEGGAALMQALESDQAAETDRIVLAKARKAFSLRAELEAANASTSKLATAEKTLADAVEAERKAVEERDQAVSASKVAKADRDKKRADYDAIGPELDKAQRLDALIETARTDLTNQKEALDRSVSARKIAQDAVAVVETDLKSARDQRDNDTRWLAEHQSLEALAARIEDVANDLSERLTLSSEVASAAEKVELLDREAKAAGASRKKKEADITALQAQERELGERIAAFSKIADAIDKASVEAKRDAIMRTQAALDGALDAADEAGKASAEIVSADAEKAKQDTLIREARAAIDRIDAELPANTARLEEARRSLELSEAAGSEAAEHLRLKLEDGQPCPVCGATEHPVTEVDRLLKERAAADRERVAGLEAKVSASQKGRTRAETQIAAAEDALQGVSKRKSDYEGELQAARQRWNASIAVVMDSCGQIGVTAPALAEDAALAAAAETISPLREMLDKILGEAKETIKRASEAEADATRLSSDRETVRAGLASASAEIAKLKDEEHLKVGEAKTLGATLQGMDKTLAAVSSRLDTVLTPSFPDWKGTVADLGGEFAEVCRNLVDEWQARRKTAEATRTEIARLDAALEGKRATLTAAETTATEAEKLHANKQGDLDRVTAERTSVIGGRPASEVRTEYSKRSEAAEKAWSDAEPRRYKAERAAAAKSADVVSARKTVETAKSDQESAERALREKLQAGGIGREEAGAAIGKGEVWLQEEQARLDALHEAVTTVKTTLAERKDAVERHLAAGCPDVSKDEVEAALVDIEVRRVEAAGRNVEANSVLRQDDQARSRIAEIKTDLDARREKARVWRQLDDLIGAADGTKFRRFAQSLTLNHLIQLANRHLADLHPRYELQRAQGADLVLQVIDRNMADEVRGVHNLSGGERFLVSLALALGLASMSSARGVKVESLFIDEGFGGLDSNSLAMAVSVLEQLQATGRQVGVISHVEELKERIAVRIEITKVRGERSAVQVVTA